MCTPAWLLLCFLCLVSGWALGDFLQFRHIQAMRKAARYFAYGWYNERSWDRNKVPAEVEAKYREMLNPPSQLWDPADAPPLGEQRSTWDGDGCP